MNFQSFFFILCVICVICVISVPCNSFVESFVPLYKKAPLIISDECRQLNQVLKETSQKKSCLVFFNYKVDQFTMENIKTMYRHVYEIGLIVEHVREQKAHRIIDFKMKRENNLFQNQYNEDVQIFNILRAFVNGNLELENQALFSKESWQNQQKVSKLLKNVYEKYTIGIDKLFFFSNVILFDGLLKRKDSLSHQIYDTSRHMFLVEDLVLEKKVEYLNSITNPIGIKIQGRVGNKKLLQNIRQLHNKEKKLVLVVSLSKLQSMKRQIPILLKNLTEKEKLNIIFCLEMNGRPMFYEESIKRELKFFDRIMDQHNVINGGLFLNFKIENGSISTVDSKTLI